MVKNEFDVGGIMAAKFKLATFCCMDYRTRELLRKSALSVLETAYQSGTESNEDGFTSILSGRRYDLDDKQKLLVRDICLAANSEYRIWREEEESEKQRIQALRAARTPSDIKRPRTTSSSDIAGLHGGSGYTGLLAVGLAAPHGAESYHAADEPRMGLEYWVNKVTAGGFGAGHSLGELSGARHAKSPEAVISTDMLYRRREIDLLDLMDKATNPGNFLRAMLAYYKQSMIIHLDNIGSVNSANLNNPDNIRTMGNLDTVFRHMRKIDDRAILTPERETRFLVLCDSLLQQVKIKSPRSRDIVTHEKYRDQQRYVRAVTSEIRDLMEQACRRSGISVSTMLIRISADKRARFESPDLAFEQPAPTKP